MFIGELSQNGHESVVTQTPGRNATITLRGGAVNFKLDTGAEVNVLLLKIFNGLPKQKTLTESDIALVAYGEERIKPLVAIIL